MGDKRMTEKDSARFLKHSSSDKINRVLLRKEDRMADNQISMFTYGHPYRHLSEAELRDKNVEQFDATKKFLHNHPGQMKHLPPDYNNQIVVPPKGYVDRLKPEPYKNYYFDDDGYSKKWNALDPKHTEFGLAPDAPAKTEWYTHPPLPAHWKEVRNKEGHITHLYDEPYINRNGELVQITFHCSTLILLIFITLAENILIRPKDLIVEPQKNPITTKLIPLIRITQNSE